MLQNLYSAQLAVQMQNPGSLAGEDTCGCI